MGRNIIICCDGTGNRFGRRNTNIVKICECLERAPDQIVYYDPGVGTLGDQRALTAIKRKLSQMLGGAIGTGLLENVQEAYDFLAANHQEGDRVFLFGFSRGAYSVRALAALVHMYGLTAPGTGNLTPYLTEMHSDNEDAGDVSTGGPAHDASRWEIANSFKKHFGRPVAIDFVGVFDTVASVGWFWSPLRLPFTTKNKSVKCVRHAVAIDERRAFFLPNLYLRDREGTEGAQLPPHVKEVWFPGVHSDVGGGYKRPEQGLAQVALEWMLREAAAAGLRLDPEKVQRVLHEKYPEPNASADQHWSLTWAWWVLELVPKLGRSPGKDHRWHLSVVFNCFRRRKIPRGATMHRSVKERWEKRGDWRPGNLGELEGYPQEA